MRKLTLLSLIFFSTFIANQLFATIYSIKTKNGSSFGFDITKYTIANNGDVTIICINPGYEKLPLNFGLNTEIKSAKTLNAEKTLQILISKIEAGILNGNEIINGNKTSWNVDSKNLLNADITIEQI